MEQRIYDLPDAPLPLNPNSYYEVLVPDVSSATGYTSCKVKPTNITGVRRLKGTITQTEDNAPVLTILENTLGVVPTITYGDVGSYYLSSPGLFPNANKVFKYIEEPLSAGYNRIVVDTANDLNIITVDKTETARDEALNNTSFLIEVYP